jgi:hypothetical protein
MKHGRCAPILEGRVPNVSSAAAVFDRADGVGNATLSTRRVVACDTLGSTDTHRHVGTSTGPYAGRTSVSTHGTIGVIELIRRLLRLTSG